MKVPNSLIGAAGEYLVAAELSRRGWLATVTIKNAPGTDVLAQDLESKRVVAIQTKTATREGRWILGRQEEAPTTAPDEWFVLVSLGKQSSDQRFWVMPRNHVAAYIWVGHRLWLRQPGRGGRAHRESAIRNIRTADIAAYEDRWEWLKGPSTDVSYSLLPEWFRDGVRGADVGLRADHPDVEKLGAVPIDLVQAARL